jgi:hypothetical protein
VGVVMEATRCLGNLASSYENHQPLLKVNAAAALVLAATTANDAVTARFAAVGLGNLAAQGANAEILMAAHAHEPLIALAGGEKRTWHFLAEDGSVTEVPGMIAEVDKVGFDMQSRRYAALALGNLLISPASHAAVVSTGFLQVAEGCLRSDDPETRFYTAYALNKLAMGAGNIDAMGRSGIIAPLIKLIKDDADCAKLHAVACLRRMACSAENRITIVAANALEQLNRAARLTNLEIQREVAACLCNLAMSDQNRTRMAFSSLITGTLQLAQSEDVECSRMACAAIANIAENTLTHVTLVKQCNAQPRLIFLMRSKHPTVHREATRAVSNILSTASFHENFLYEDGLRSLFAVSKSTDSECQYLAAMCFRKLTPILSNHDAILSKGGLQPLITLVQLKAPPVQRQAAAALRELAANKDHKMTLAQEGGLKCLIALARDADVELRILAVGGLRHLSINTRIKRPMVEEGALGPIFDSALRDPPNMDLLTQCSATLANLAENPQNQVRASGTDVMSTKLHYDLVGDSLISRPTPLIGDPGEGRHLQGDQPLQQGQARGGDAGHGAPHGLADGQPGEPGRDLRRRGGPLAAAAV